MFHKLLLSANNELVLSVAGHGLCVCVCECVWRVSQKESDNSDRHCSLEPSVQISTKTREKQVLETSDGNWKNGATSEVCCP